ncbi:XRE family transcriptional regulator [Streptomyces sp. V3I7]|uniref:XRE family transcriptional regulator n=1 Tax=Streptomyces sp. V3I7 TaxID=3042278 RepID=UPI002780BE48|nr:XRE family transcriptional regulator [Streptomyces sp. V3I7]MDQ0993863.1 transcriptional regulator with XRE-family HTH domain [Streptomyces sp. V3I7]
MIEAVEQVGGRLRQLRRSRSLTLAELADRANLTSGYLANVENGVTTPSLSALSTLAAVLGTDMSAFFPSSGRETVHVHRAAGAEHLKVEAGRARTYTILSARSVDPAFTGLLDHIEPPEVTSPYSCFGERLLLVLEGQIEARVGATVLRLGPGETLHYSSHPEHALKVLSDEPAVILWVVTPAIL